MPIDLWDLVIDDANIEEMAHHGVTMRNAFEVIEDDPRRIPNTSPDGAPLLIVGMSNRGLVTIPLDAAFQHGDWRARTAYPAKVADEVAYQKARSLTE